MNNYKTLIADTISGLKDGGAIPYSGAKILLIELFFAFALPSYVSRNAEGQKIVDKYGKLFEYTPNPDKSDEDSYMDFISGFDLDLFYDVLRVVERDYGLPKEFLVNTFSTSKLFQNVVDNNPLMMIDMPYLMGLLPFTFEECAQTIKTLLNIPQINKDELNTQQFITNENLQILVSKILKTADNETFVDCGFGLFGSSLYNEAKKYRGYERNRGVAGIGAIVAILTGKEVEIFNQDCALIEDENVADKLFWDTASFDYDKSKDKLNTRLCDPLNMSKAVQLLKDGGTAAVTCTGGFCIKQDSASVREILLKDHLKAVISLPPMWQGTKINTFVVVLQKNCNPKDIMFINAAGIDVGENGRANIKTSDMEMIEDALGGKEIPGFSARVSVQDILESPRKSLMPSHYLRRGRSVDYRPTTVIECDLMEAYSQFQELIG